MTANEKLTALSLSYTQQNKTLFSNLNFELSAGELLLIEGENGSGKSTLLRILSGLTLPHTGQILWCDVAIEKNRAQYQASLNYASHGNGLKLSLTVLENLELACYLQKPILATRAIPHSYLNYKFDNALKQLQLNDYQNTPVKELSAGLKRRVMLAKLFLIEQKIWILDEPLTSLDQQTQTIFFDILQKHLNNNGMAIISSHHVLDFNNLTTKRINLSAC